MSASPALTLALGPGAGFCATAGPGAEISGYRVVGACPPGSGAAADPVVRFNDACLQSFCLTRNAVRALDASATEGELAFWAGRAAALLGELLDGGGRICIADPSVALLAPVWRRAFEEADLHPDFVIGVPPPDVAAKAWAHANDAGLPHGHLAWTCLVVGSERLSRGYSRVLVPVAADSTAGLEGLLQHAGAAGQVQAGMWTARGESPGPDTGVSSLEIPEQAASMSAGLHRALRNALARDDSDAVAEAVENAAGELEVARTAILWREAEDDGAAPSAEAMAALRSRLTDLRRERADQRGNLARLEIRNLRLRRLAVEAASAYGRVMNSPLFYLREQYYRTLARLLLKLPMLSGPLRARLAAAREKRSSDRFLAPLGEVDRDDRADPVLGPSAAGAGSAGYLAASLRAASEPDPAHYRGYSRSALPSPMPVRSIAYYLPQFHPTPENDEWWGPGFTEWTNVSKAIPRFPGHYQPRFPGELGYYDLRVPAVMARQVKLAREYGISGFCFHYYWFNGRRILEAPLEYFLSQSENADFDFPFCVNWANENWTRRWDGGEQHVLLAQKHSLQDHRDVFHDIARYMKDRRYIRVNGRPVVLVYRPAIIGDVREMCAIWREEAEKLGFPGLELLATNAFEFRDYGDLGFDGLVQFPPHGKLSADLAAAETSFGDDFSGALFDYGSEVELQMNQLRGLGRASSRRVFPCVFPGWDNEARRSGRGTAFHDATPDKFARWFGAACDYAMDRFEGEERLVFVNAWNEWAEGAYLEPDRRYGYACLDAIRDRLQGLSHPGPDATPQG